MLRDGLVLAARARDSSARHTLHCPCPLPAPIECLCPTEPHPDTYSTFYTQLVWCHHYDFLVCFQNRLNFFELFKLLFSLGIDHDPPCFLCSHDLCLFPSYVSLFTRSYGQEKSLLYYDLFDFRVLFYGRTPTLIFIFHLLDTPPLYSPLISS